MTDQNHPITPPHEPFKQWKDDILSEQDNVDHVLDRAWRHGFLAGADQELEACVKWIEDCGYHPFVPVMFRAARRPKPPSDKELALKALALIERTADAPVPTNKESLSLIRRALKALPE